MAVIREVVSRAQGGGSPIGKAKDVRFCTELTSSIKPISFIKPPGFIESLGFCG